MVSTPGDASQNPGKAVKTCKSILSWLKFSLQGSAFEIFMKCSVLKHREKIH